MPLLWTSSWLNHGATGTTFETYFCIWINEIDNTYHLKISHLRLGFIFKVIEICFHGLTWIIETLVPKHLTTLYIYS